MPIHGVFLLRDCALKRSRITFPLTQPLNVDHFLTDPIDGETTQGATNASWDASYRIAEPSTSPSTPEARSLVPSARRLQSIKRGWQSDGGDYSTVSSLLRASSASLMISRYEYFDRNINVAVMARELAQALDDEAELRGDHGKPGSRYRHARDPTGKKDMTICEFHRSLSAVPTLILCSACYNLAKACGVAGLEDWHHNAGVDARESLASVLAMMFAYPGVTLPQEDIQMPVLAAVDL